MLSDNGCAIIRGKLVPRAEVAVLREMIKLGQPATVPMISIKMSGQMSDASLYSLLRRLAGRGLAERNEAKVGTFGRTVKRVFWSTSVTEEETKTS